MKVEVAVQGSQSLTVVMVSVDVKHRLKKKKRKTEVAVLDSQSLTVVMVSVFHFFVKQHLKKKKRVSV